MILNDFVSTTNAQTNTYMHRNTQVHARQINIQLLMRRVFWWAMLAEHYNCILIMSICRPPTIRTSSGDVFFKCRWNSRKMNSLVPWFRMVLKMHTVKSDNMHGILVSDHCMKCWLTKFRGAHFFFIRLHWPFVLHAIILW